MVPSWKTDFGVKVAQQFLGRTKGDLGGKKIKKRKTENRTKRNKRWAESNPKEAYTVSMLWMSESEVKLDCG